MSNLLGQGKLIKTITISGVVMILISIVFLVGGLTTQPEKLVNDRIEVSTLLDHRTHVQTVPREVKESADDVTYVT